MSPRTPTLWLQHNASHTAPHVTKKGGALPQVISPPLLLASRAFLSPVRCPAASRSLLGDTASPWVYVREWAHACVLGIPTLVCAKSMWTHDG